MSPARVLCLVSGAPGDDLALSVAMGLAAADGGPLLVATCLPAPAGPGGRSISGERWDDLLRDHAAAILEHAAEQLAAGHAHAQLAVLHGCDSRSIAAEARHRGVATVVMPGPRWCRLARRLRRRAGTAVVCV